MFERFTERSRRVLQTAQEEAERFNHNYIGTEHLLLGLLRVEDGVAARTLTSLGVDLVKVRQSVEFIIGRGDRTVAGQIGLTPRAKRVMEFTIDEARSLGHEFVGTEHLLLGLAREGEGIASGILESFGVDSRRVRSEVIAVLNGPQPLKLERGELGQPPLSKYAMEALDEAELAAAWLRHPVVDVEHALLGLVRLRSGLASQALARVGVTFETLQQLVVSSRGYGQGLVRGPAIYSQQLQETLKRAHEISHAGGATATGTGHLLLALIDSEVLAQLLPDRGPLQRDVEERLTREGDG